MTPRALCLAVACLFVCSCSQTPDPAPSPDVGDDVGEMGADVSRQDDIGNDASADLGADAAGSMDGPVEVRTSGGVVVGERVDGMVAMLGIPYAQPPVGELRWAPPVAATWTEPFDAAKFGPRCPQPNITFTSTPGDEDCLSLNVWTALDDTPKPIMVWFHGGSFVQGASRDKTYVGADLARHDVVVVTANYRLGALGFLAHRDLPGHNFGLQDQLAVLDWVQQNAAAIGGDPDNVTVFGESAGGIGTCLLVASGQNEGRFDRAILESGPCTGLLDLPTATDAEAQGDALATAVGCDTAADVVACLRAADAETVTSALGYRPGVIFGDGAAWVPVRDDDLVPVDVDAALANADTPFLLGANAAEGNLVVLGATQGIVTVDYLTTTQQMFPDDVDAVRAQYPLADYADEIDAIATIVGDRFVCGTRKVARIRADAGHTTWLYHFTHPFVTPIGDLGAMHGAELPLVFGTELTLVPLPDADIPLSEEMQRYWTRFAATGDPNGGGDPTWPPYTTSSDEHIVLDTVTSTGAALRRATCDFWDGIDGN